MSLNKQSLALPGFLRQYSNYEPHEVESTTLTLREELREAAAVASRAVCTGMWMPQACWTRSARTGCPSAMVGAAFSAIWGRAPARRRLGLMTAADGAYRVCREIAQDNADSAARAAVPSEAGLRGRAGLAGRAAEGVYSGVRGQKPSLVWFCAENGEARLGTQWSYEGSSIRCNFLDDAWSPSRDV